jgi:hypothetical protein
MIRIACLCLALTAAMPLWSQVEPSGSGGGLGLDDSQMLTPAPVSENAYPETVGSETRSNFLSGGLVFTGAYVDNLLLGNDNGPISDETYSFVPTISFDRKTPRQDESLSYSSGFTLYQHTSQLNSVAQSATAGYRYHISKYTVLVLGDTFQQNNNLYNQSNPFSGGGGGVSGAPGQSSGFVISPYENQLTNSSNAGINYQYGRNAMIGGSGTYYLQQFSESADVSGLSNQGAAGANGFFSRRFGRSQYVGVRYQFSKFVTHPFDTYSVTNTVFGFYTFYFTRSFSLSILGGPEHYTTWSPATPSQGSWTPAVEASFGWQTPRTNITAAYSHIVAGVGGLIGTYQSDIASMTGRLALSRRWNLGANLNYSLFNNVNANPGVAYGTPGNSFFGGVYLDRQITERVSAQAGYGYFHEDYPGIPSASTYPNSNRVNISIMYQFNRPLGR